MHQLACLRGAPNLHAQIVQAPEFFKLKQLIRARRVARGGSGGGSRLLPAIAAAWGSRGQACAPERPPRRMRPLPAVERRGELTARNISNMLWSLAKINHHPGAGTLGLGAAAWGAPPGPRPGWAGPAARTCLPTSPALSRHTAADHVATPDHPCPGDEFLAALAGEIRTKAKQGGNAQNVANVLWAFGTLGAPRCVWGTVQGLFRTVD